MVNLNPEMDHSVGDPPKIIQPREHKAKVCLWKDLSVSNLDELESIQSPGLIKSALARIFEIDTNEENVKAQILLDLYYYTIQFARTNKFSKEQTSAFFSMVKTTHEICTETPFANLKICFAHFRELVLCHAVKRPPFSLDIFSPDEVKKITEHVINTYFRHYKMYKYVFTPLVRLDLALTYPGLPITPDEEKVDDTDAKEEPTIEVQPPEEEEKAEEPQEEESEAAKELRAMIKSHLEEEIKKLRLSVDDQLKTSEDNLNKKISAVEGLKTPGKATRGGSGKGKKK